MALPSPAEANPAPRLLLEAQVRECYGRVVYTHKTHEKCADILLSRLGWIKLWQIGLSSITTVSFLVILFGNSKFGGLFGVAVSGALLALNMYTKNYDLGELAQKHRQAANDIWLIREKYLSLLTDLRVGKVSLEKMMERRDVLLDELHATYGGAPSTTHDAYRKAQEALQTKEDLTFSDAEIDAFLPQALHKT